MSDELGAAGDALADAGEMALVGGEPADWKRLDDAVHAYRAARDAALVEQFTAVANVIRETLQEAQVEISEETARYAAGNVIASRQNDVVREAHVEPYRTTSDDRPLPHWATSMVRVRAFVNAAGKSPLATSDPNGLTLAQFAPNDAGHIVPLYLEDLKAILDQRDSIMKEK